MFFLSFAFPRGTVNPFDAYLEKWAARVDEALERALPPTTAAPARLHEAMRYTVFAGGKRLRPVLCLLAARASGGDEVVAMPAAVAVEMVHAFSLIHDDLPAMDDDELRRGKPTNHVVFGEALAVLAGDGLLAHAFGALTELPLRDAVPEAVRVLADAVGSAGLVGGQVEDVAAEGEEPDRATVESIHRKKTAALFRACARLGALAAGAGSDTIERLSRYAECLGLAFQIVDDVLDETSSAAELGKTVGKDLAEKKMTYPAAVGLDRSRARARELAGEAAEATSKLAAADLLGALADRAVERTY
jgi:geranylgeranyl diphosphate synthase type II